MRHGRNCVLISSLILLACGIGCMAACYSAVDLIGNTWDSACDTVAQLTTCVNLQDACYDTCEKQYNDTATSGVDQATRDSALADCNTACVDIPDQPYTKEQCEVDLKKEAECVCTGDTVDSCDCSDAPMSQIEDFWRTGCLALGAVGLVGCTLLTGIPGLISSFKKVKCCNIVFYSVFCGLLCWIFLAVGGLFVAIAMAFKVGPVKDFLDDCDNLVAEQAGSGIDSDTSSALDSAGATGAVNDSVDCGSTAFCDGIRTLSNDAYVMSLSIGVPFFLAGLIMFFGMYACCCCKKSLPGNNDQVQVAEMKS